MSARKSIYVHRKKPCAGGETPNAYVPQISVEIRVHFPPHLGNEEAAELLLDAAANEAFAAIHARDEGRTMTGEGRLDPRAIESMRSYAAAAGWTDALADAWDEGRAQGHRDTEAVETHTHPSSIGTVCHGHGQITHWHEGGGPAWVLERTNPYREMS